MAISSKLRDLSESVSKRTAEARSRAARAKQKAAEKRSGAAEKVREAIKSAPAPSPNPMTNLVLADIAMRSGGRLLRHAVETTLLGSVLGKPTARQLVSSRSLKQTVVSTIIARVATRSVPGALLVGGGLAAKAYLDRRQGRRKAQAEGEAAVAEQAAQGDSS